MGFMIVILGDNLFSSSFSFALSTLSVNKSSRFGEGGAKPITSSKTEIKECNAETIEYFISY